MPHPTSSAWETSYTQLRNFHFNGKTSKQTTNSSTILKSFRTNQNSIKNQQRCLQQSSQSSMRSKQPTVATTYTLPRSQSPTFKNTKKPARKPQNIQTSLKINFTRHASRKLVEQLQFVSQYYSSCDYPESFTHPSLGPLDIPQLRFLGFRISIGNTTTCRHGRECGCPASC
jgi:hypothetical protein